MKKLFFALLFLCVVGAGVLWWLMHAVPAPNPLAPKESEVSVHDLTAHEGDKEEAASEGEHGSAEGTEHASEHATEAHGEAPKPEETTPDTAKEAGKAVPEESHAAQGPQLHVSTEPVAAGVWVDGKELGQTPLSVDLESKKIKLVLKAEGFEDFTREAPRAADSHGDLNWKVELKPRKGSLTEAPHKEEKAPPKRVAKTPKASAPKVESKPVAPTEVAHQMAPVEDHLVAESVPQAATPKAANASPSPAIWKRSPSGRWFVQLESLPADSEEDAVSRMAASAVKTGTTLHGCRVDLGSKGRWIRVLAGPFGSKIEAAAELARMQSLDTERAPTGAFVTGAQKCQ